VRPGAAPPARRRTRPLGPTPRYAVIPRWGLVDHFEAPEQHAAAPRSGPSLGAVRATLIATMVVLGVAALVHVVRYALLIVNRSVLLNKVVAFAATWLGVLVSVIALFMVVASLVVLTNWLIARRAAAYTHHRRDDPRSASALRAGCLVPLVNLFFAPVYVIELAGIEERLRWLRRPIVVWWFLWVFSYAVSVFSIATSFTQDPQGIADNTVTTIVAYLLTLATLLVAMKVFLGFERQPVERPAKRWVVVRDDAPPPTDKRTDAEPEPAPAVESEGQNPAA
jgi:glucan phosphoethanolaminetransferase (alkaline phosphatase superfamily)